MGRLEVPRGRRWQQDDLSATNTPTDASPNCSSYKKDDIQILEFQPGDKLNPYNWSEARKWLVAGISLIGTLLLPLNGTSITIAASEINTQFGISDAIFTHSYWTVTSWSIGGAVFVIFFLSLFEDIGARLGYLYFYAFFFLVVIPQAVAQNFATLVVTRFFSGGCVALLANVIASIIPDLWEGEKARSIPVGIYILLYVEGSTLGPPIFAGVAEYLGWRWIFYIQLIFYGAYFPVVYFLVPETRGQVILRREAKRLRHETGREIYSESDLDKTSILMKFWKSISRPAYLLFTEPVLFACTLWSAFSFGTVFLFTQSVEQVFKATYGWTAYECGYVQAAVAIGELFGWSITLYGSHLFLASASRNKEFPGRPIPEARLYVSVFASFIGITGGMFVYAWTSFPFIHWIAPAMGLFMVGLGIQITITTIADYVTDAYAESGYAGSAISAVAAGENIIAGFLPLAAFPMYTNLGFQWASTLLAFMALLLSFIPVVVIPYGRLLRERSPFMQSGGRSGAGTDTGVVDGEPKE